MNAHSKSSNEGSVYQHITNLCECLAVAAKPFQETSDHVLIRKMRSRGFEIIFNESNNPRIEDENPVSDLLACYFVKKTNIRNVVEYENVVKLKESIDNLMNNSAYNEDDTLKSLLKLVVLLKESEDINVSEELYKRPFSMGDFGNYLPKLTNSSYSYFPEDMFHLKFQIPAKSMDLVTLKSSIRNTGTKSFFVLPLDLEQDSNNMKNRKIMFEIPRLTEPRHLFISNHNESMKSLESSVIAEQTISESSPQDDNYINVWDIPLTNKDVSQDIWDVAINHTTRKESRPMISWCQSQVNLWKRKHNLRNLCLVTEELLIKHLMYLCIGIESTSFTIDLDNSVFHVRNGLSIQGVSNDYLNGYFQHFLMVGTCYMRLYKFAFEFPIEEKFQSGFIYEAARNTLRSYLQWFRQRVMLQFDESWKNNLPSLLTLLHWIEPMKREIATVASIYTVIDAENESTLPKGVALMSYLYEEISMVTESDTAQVMFTALHQICSIYFKFIERLIFEGELDDPHHEFFIRKSSDYENFRSRRWWDRGLMVSGSVPNFLETLAKHILLCGKSLRLLKLCNPQDPLMILLSGNHPAIKCCTTFEEIDEQKKILELYRTRCLFVSGEPVTFDQILLKAEAAKKACTEMAAIKQSETMEKIIADRKRLALLIQAEKQHSLKMLEAAIAKNEALKGKISRDATDQTDSKNDENEKLQEYYKKLNNEVEKQKMHSDWKMKRLQLDKTRMQLLSSEERNYKHEKLEKELGSLELSTIVETPEPNEDGMTLSVTDVTNNNASFEANSDILEVKSLDSEGNVIENESKTVNRETDTLCTATSAFEDALNSNILVVNTAFIENETLQTKIDNYVSDQARDSKSISYTTKCKLLGRETGLKAEQSKSNTTDTTDTKTKILDTKIQREPVKIMHVLEDTEDKFLQNNKETKNQEAKENTHINPDRTLIVEKGVITPHHIAQQEAIANKHKILDNEFNIKIPRGIRMPQNVAQKEAVENKFKMMNNEFNPKEERGVKTPQNVAQEEAAANKHKIMENEFNIEREKYVRKVQNVAQHEALLNKQKILNIEFNIEGTTGSKILNEAEANNISVMNNDFNMGSSTSRKPLEYNTQEEALKNKVKAIKSDNLGSSGSPRRAALSLNLDSARSGSRNNILTPTPGGLTPSADLLAQLELETPTTADPNYLDTGIPTLSPDKGIKPKKKSFLIEDGFHFPNTSLIEGDILTELDETEKGAIKDSKCYWDLEETFDCQSYDPFNVKNINIYTKCYFTEQLKTVSKTYTDIRKLLEKTSEKPKSYSNIFDADQKFRENNFATLKACLQRSVLLPLSYQLEVVNNSILTYFLVNLDLYGHLQSVKDYFFLMDGEFSNSICENLFNKVSSISHFGELMNFTTLHGFLDKAITASISSKNKYSDRLSFTITEHLLTISKLGSINALDGLTLSYNVDWPLDLVLTPDAIRRYASVFHFLLKMRRVAWALNNNFQELKISAKLYQEKGKRLFASPQYHAVQLYRHVMSSLIRALDNYIVTTCIQSSWKELEQGMKSARTLDDLFSLHELYVKKVIFRCLLNKRSVPLMKMLEEIFSVILRFSKILNSREWTLEPDHQYYTTQCFEQLKDLYTLCERLTKRLHTLVSKLLECGYQPHLNELLTMININEYYHPLPR